MMLRRFSTLSGLALLSLLSGCNLGGSGGSGQIGATDALEFKPGSGDAFFVDPNQGGSRGRLLITRVAWGRLVDVFDVDATTGDPNPTPVFRDMVVDENLLADADYELRVSPLTQRSELIVRRTLGVAVPGGETFEDLVRAAKSRLAPIQPLGDDGSFPGPFSMIARNATLVLQFDDLLDDGPVPASRLDELVRVLVGYPPTVPFPARLRFDANHGGVVSGVFHSSRILVDMTVSPLEAAEPLTDAPVNAIGLPASDVTSEAPNLAIRIPTRTAPGQPIVLRGLQGGLVDNNDNGPVDPFSATEEVVRAIRTGNAEDTNNGFHFDATAPELIGTMSIDVRVMTDLPGGDAGFDFLSDFAFDVTDCALAGRVGDLVTVNGRALEVLLPTSSPTPGENLVTNVRLRALSATPLLASDLVGLGTFQTTYEPGLPISTACFLSFQPEPLDAPDGGIANDAQITLRFSEPVDPASLSAFGTIQVSAATEPITAETTVVATLTSSTDQQEVLYAPLFAYPSAVSTGMSLHLTAGDEGITDLAGNAMAALPSLVPFVLDASAPARDTDGIVLRFDSVDEWQPDANPKTPILDLRGQMFYDFDRSLIFPRPVARFTASTDRFQPIASMFHTGTPGFPDPSAIMVPFGSRQHFVWRYCDFGWTIDDESRNNLEIEGLSWVPFNGQVASEFYPEFEMRLSYATRLPDEGGMFPFTGLNPPTQPFEANILPPISSQQIVHNRGLGYRVNPAELFELDEVPLVPFPWNRSGGQRTSFLWRNTADLRTAGLDPNAGVPLEAELAVGLYPGEEVGDRYAGNQLPTVALPLLIETRTPVQTFAVAQFRMEIGVAGPAPNFVPTFRSYSSGGVDTTGTTILKDPDLQEFPDGGFFSFNPLILGQVSSPIDNFVHYGAIDAVTRVSRCHTIFFDTGATSPVYSEPLVEAFEPNGTQVLLEFRGARAFTGNNAVLFAQQAERLDFYGNLALPRRIQFAPGTEDGWFSAPSQLDGARFLQMRFTFIGNLNTSLTPSLDTVAVGFERP